MVKSPLTKALIFCAALILMVNAGCGGGSSGGPSLTKGQFIKRAKAICTQAETEQFKNGFAYLEEHPGIDEEEAVLPAALPPIEKELKELRDLGAPDGDETKVEVILNALEKALEETKKDPGRALERKGNPFETPNKLAERYGLQGCSGNP